MLNPLFELKLILCITVLGIEASHLAGHLQTICILNANISVRRPAIDLCHFREPLDGYI